ncbi:MAG: type II secretion system protein [candidate division SR1 bacterium]|nr:type II secretion system protein [candidate division SR1 bacterium]
MLPKNKKGFTVLEMIIVVVVLGILMAAGIYRLGNLDTNRFRAEVCVNEIYGSVSSFVYYASTSKMIDGNIPVYYQLSTSGENDGVVDLKYAIANRGEFSFTGGHILLSEKESCKSGTAFKVKSTSSFTTFKMHPRFKPVGNRNGIEMTNDQGAVIFKGSIDFQFCSPTNDPKCYEFARILFDARTGIVKKAFCKFYKISNDQEEDRKCKEWSAEIE